MKKIITALGNPNLSEKIKKYKKKQCSKKQIEKLKEINKFQDEIAKNYFNTNFKKKN